MDAYLEDVVMEEMDVFDVDLNVSLLEENDCVITDVVVAKVAPNPDFVIYIPREIWNSVPSKPLHPRRTPAPQQWYCCPYPGCLFTTRSRGSMTSHENRHRKPYHCACGKSFLTMGAYKIHRH
jgi:hypothetical protein